MKPTGTTTEQGESVFKTGTCVSDAGSWYSSLARQLREIREERRNPRTPVQITAAMDMSALDKLVQDPSSWQSLTAGIRSFIDESLHPRKIETTATPVEVEEIWSKQKNRRTETALGWRTRPRPHTRANPMGDVTESSCRSGHQHHVDRPDRPGFESAA